MASHGNSRSGTAHSETNREVQKIIDLRSLANQLHDHFSERKTVTESHVHDSNAWEKGRKMV